MKNFIIFFAIIVVTPTLAQSELPLNSPSKLELDSLTIELELIFRKDQTFRRIYREAEQKLGVESVEMEYFWEVVEAQDKVLEKKITQMIDQYGWLGISQVGRRANTAQWAVLQHGSAASKQKYAPLLKASVLNNESQAIHYARLIDRMLINSDKPQLYGTQYTYDNPPTFFEIEAPEYINKRRNELGLNSIEEFAASINIDWTIKQK